MTQLPNEWQLKKISEIAEVNPRRPKLERADDAPTTFVPMPAVDGTLGEITNAQEKPFSAVKKGYTYFEEGDVIFAKITPCMENGKHAVARDLTDGVGFGSTEFHVIRPNNGVSAEWIWLQLRRQSVLDELETHFTGSVGQQRVPPDSVRDVVIPVPPPDEQERLTVFLRSRLAQVIDAQAAAERSRSAIPELERALIGEAFAALEERDPARAPLREVADFIRGVSFSKHEARREPADDHLPILRAGNIQRDLILDDDLQWIPSERVKPAQRLQLGDVVMAVSSSTALAGKTALLREEWEGTFGAFCGVFRPHADVEPEFLALWFRSAEYMTFREKNVRQTTNIANLDLSSLQSYLIPFPKEGEQRAVIADARARIDAAHRLADYYERVVDDLAQAREAVLAEASQGGI